MKIKKFVFSITLGFCLLNLPVSASSLIKIRGIVNLEEDYLFSVLNTETNQSRWIKFNQEFGGLIILSYNPSDTSVEGIYQGKSIYLKLTESDPTPIELVTSQISEEAENNRVLNETEIEQMVNNYRNRELAKLPDETSQHYASLKQSTENRINAYKFALVDQNRKLLAPTLMLTNETRKHSNARPIPIGTQRK